MEGVEATGFGCHDFGGESAAEILIDDAIKGGEECKDTGDEVMFGIGQPGPVHEVCREVDLFCQPERGFSFLEHPSTVGMVDAEDYKAMWILLQ